MYMQTFITYLSPLEITICLCDQGPTCHQYLVKTNFSIRGRMILEIGETEIDNLTTDEIELIKANCDFQSSYDFR